MSQGQKDSGSGFTSKLRGVHPWSGSRILVFYPSGISQKGTRSRIRIRNTGYYFLCPSSYLCTVNTISKLIAHLPLLVTRRLGEWRNRTGAMPRAAASTIPLPTFRPPPTRPSCCSSHPQRGRRRGWFSPWCGVSFRPGTTGRIPREAANLPEPVSSRQNLLPAKKCPRQNLFPAEICFQLKKNWRVSFWCKSVRF